MSTLSLATSESVTLRFAPDRSGTVVPEDLLLVAVRTGADASGSRRLIPVATEALPARVALHNPEPNPAAGRVSLRFDLPAPAPVRLEIFDLLGRKVRSLENGWRPAGTTATSWDGRDASGRVLSAGVYVARLSTGSERLETKIALIP